ncbi:MAG TPA: HAD-IC family P-type ATPase, partial [Candidatus Peribacteria bacterium]|nr:HAD-IC family P-type ATPase [Candidatus Peribacteria bacterium]
NVIAFTGGAIDDADTHVRKVVRIAASMEHGSEHPLADSIVRYASQLSLRLSQAEGFAALPGHGIRAVVDGTPYVLGNARLMQQMGVYEPAVGQFSRQYEEAGRSVVLLADATRVLGLLAIADTLKPGAAQAVSDLRALGMEVILLSGDNTRTTAAIGREAGISRVLGDILPERKAGEIAKLQTAGNIVAMVGDGMNDSPALARADVGIAMGGGTDIAIETGGIVLAQNDPRHVAVALRLSRASVSKIRQNLFFALFYNVIGIPIAARVLTGFGLVLRPELAGLAMALSSVSVVGNSLTLKLFHPSRRNAVSEIAPYAMAIGFTLLFFFFARLSA